MPRMNTRDTLEEARKQRFAVCAYNVDALDYMRAIVAAAEEERAPIILEAVESALEGMGLKYFARLAGEMAKDAKVPVGIHLDHGTTIDWVKACLDEGFSSVMIDASHKPLKENIRITQEVVRLAEKYGAFSEGEIGHVPGIEENSEGLCSDLVYTDPDQAAEYCRESGVHSLAVSIGTVHYMRREPLKLDFHLLDRIREAVKVPLVLHGGAAVTDPDMRAAVDRGIAKYNIAYKGYKAFLAGLEEGFRNIKEEIMPGKLFVFPSEVMKAGVESSRKEIQSKIRLLGGSGRA